MKKGLIIFAGVVLFLFGVMTVFNYTNAVTAGRKVCLNTVIPDPWWDDRSISDKLFHQRGWGVDGNYSGQRDFHLLYRPPITTVAERAKFYCYYDVKYPGEVSIYLGPFTKTHLERIYQSDPYPSVYKSLTVHSGNPDMPYVVRFVFPDTSLAQRALSMGGTTGFYPEDLFFGPQHHSWIAANRMPALIPSARTNRVLEAFFEWAGLLKPTGQLRPFLYYNGITYDEYLAGKDPNHVRYKDDLADIRAFRKMFLEGRYKTDSK